MFNGLTDSKIEEFIKVPKRLTNPKTKPVTKSGHIQKNYDVESQDGIYKFILYTRQNQMIGDDFSCGLKLLRKNEEISLLRYNGKSHIHKNKIEKTSIVLQYHIHRATERYINNPICKHDGFAEITDKYFDLDSAFLCLTKDCNIKHEISSQILLTYEN